LRQKRSSYDSHWSDIGDHLYPRRVRLNRSDRDSQGTKKNDKIVDATGTYALRTLEAGLMGGLSSPARPWFRLLSPYPGMMEDLEVRVWLSSVENTMRLSFARTNIYNCLAMCYRDLGGWGTTSALIEEDEEDPFRAYSLPIGSYFLASNDRGVVDTIFHETSLTVWQIVRRFGVQNASEQVKAMYEKGQVDAWIDVVHIIEPRMGRNPEKIDQINMPWRSCWYETGSRSEQYLYEGGYLEFPGIAARWEINGTEDVYGSSPGMQALPDVRMLQAMQRRKLDLLNRLANPALNAPAELQKKPGGASALPGHVNYISRQSAQQRVEATMQLDAKAAFLAQEIQDVRNQIREGFFVDLFRMLSEYNGPQQTAREVEEKHEEKVFQLGPVLDRLHEEILTRLIDRTFMILHRGGAFPQPPRILMGMPLRVDFISPLAQAQKLMGISSVERFFGFVGNLAAVWPSCVDKVDADQAIDEYADMTGLPPKIVRSDEDVKPMRLARQQQEQAAQMAAAAPAANQAAQATQTLSETDVNGTSALQRLLSTTVPANQAPFVAPPQAL
jgi:hypothetical protein